MDVIKSIETQIKSGLVCQGSRHNQTAGFLSEYTEPDNPDENWARENAMGE